MKKMKEFQAVGKRKEAVARAVGRPGTGLIRINKILLDAYTPEYLREMILEPIKISKEAMDVARGLDIDISVKGSGPVAQAEAARIALSKVLCAFGKKSLEREILQYDRALLKGDPRRVEPKKFKGPKARARFTKSYR